ncbi:uncharacterized protein LOC114361874 [Ostrinia furnacalis]|uniref:uncharacterized protein LOC114361874 n=1 Tax=Ostrinia furnacalis TaxID=93504 RepID=UPI00103B1698|nr:uncharacterized protein LOC114361874 [Ostrinia furnacalis]
MKTSSSQFVMMVTFMEQHGDLTKPTSNARGRLNNLKHWEDLTLLLNSDGVGDSKTTEKWKKVWCDLKNNTKRKAARLHRAATGTGGGPAVFAKLTDLELRVLNLIGVQVATGLAIEEAGLTHSAIERRANFRITAESNFISTAYIQPNWNEPGPSQIITPAQSTPPTASLSFTEEQLEETDLFSPTRPSQARIASAVRTPPRGVRGRIRGSPHRRRARSVRAEQAAHHFLQVDAHWRSLKRQQHEDMMALRREANRIRQMEVQTQMEWQAIGHRALNLLEKIVDKFC